MAISRATAPQSHYKPRTLPAIKKTLAHWAVQPNRKLLVFVHGFGGGATSTWPQFPSMLPAVAQNADIIFYGYDSLRTRAYISAVDLYNFLTSLTRAPNATITQSLGATAPRTTKAFTYSRVIIVAHSLGAVVARLALLEAYKNSDAWASMTRLILFAPAHLGADIVRLAGLALTGLPVMLPAAQLLLPALQDVEPGSGILTRLQADVTAALPSAPYLRASAVVLARRDPVVSPNPFCSDPAAIILSGVGHMSVCKPRPSFTAPLDHVTALL